MHQYLAINVSISAVVFKIYRISLAINCYHGGKHLLRSQFLNLRTKLNLYKTLLKHVLSYDSECLSLNRRNEEQLQVFERRILRKIFGPICDNGKMMYSL